MERVQPTMNDQSRRYFVLICRKYNRPTPTSGLLNLLVDLLIFTIPYRGEGLLVQQALSTLTISVLFKRRIWI
jgi:hypothetical protein